MKIKIYPSIPNGQIKAPGSKSEAIRYIISSMFVNPNLGRTVLYNVNLCDDVIKAIYVISNFGAEVEETIDDNQNATLKIKGIKVSKRKHKSITLDVGSSATLFRMIIPIALMLYKKAIIYVNEDLKKRPITPFMKFFEFEEFDNYYIISKPKFEKAIEIDGSISSQFVSGMIFAYTLRNDETSIYVKDLVSKDYVNMTIDCLKDFGIYVNVVANRYSFRKYDYQRIEKYICGDYSAASNFLTLGTFMGEVKVSGLYKSNQADERIIPILSSHGSNIRLEDDKYIVSGCEPNKCDIDVTEAIDLGPIMIVYASMMNNNIVVGGVKRLSIKESNRLHAMEEEIKKFGIKPIINNDNQIALLKSDIEIEDKCIEVNTYNDHRVAMALTILGILKNKEVILDNATCVNKSFPTFFKDLNKLGIKTEIIEEK